MNDEGISVFCEACGESFVMPRKKTLHILCGTCRMMPRQWPANTKTPPATIRELWGLREEPRNNMIGENWK